MATPIGNLSDMTFRAIDTLKNVDLIAAEDTRQTLKLLNHFEISKPMISYHRHNEDIKSECLIEKVLAGKNIAIVTDAGTPGISDPGEEIVKEAIKNNIDIIPIPGACAFVNSLIVSGISTTEFSFYGFLPLNKKNRKEKLLQIMKEQKTVILYEAPHKLLKTLEDILEKIDGAGDVKVMITYQDSGTQVVEKDKNTSENSLEESDSTGGVRSTKEQQLQESTVYEEADAGNTPFVSKELLPKVEGILIVASGGDNQKVKQNISEAVLALFQVEAHRIKIVKMSGLEDSK